MIRPPSINRREQLRSEPDTIVVSLAMTGDEAAFTELVVRQSASIRNLFRRLSGKRSLADDLAQMTFIQAWRKIGQLNSPEAFGPWLHRIAINIWLAETNRSDSRTHKHPELVETLPDLSPTPDRSLAGLDLEKALTQLKPAERLCIALSYGEGYTQKEVSDLIDMPIGTVKSHLLRASEKLRTILKSDIQDD